MTFKYVGVHMGTTAQYHECVYDLELLVGPDLRTRLNDPKGKTRCFSSV